MKRPLRLLYVSGPGDIIATYQHWRRKMVDYAYASDSTATGSRFIDNITDKKGNVFDTTWTFQQVSAGVYEAQKIETSDPIGLTNVYDRSTTSDVCTITNYDNTTAIRKIVNTPITGDTSKTRFLDYYLTPGGTQTEQWEYVYTSNDLTSTKAPGGTTYRSATFNSLGRVTASSVGSGSSATYSYPSGGLYATGITTPGGRTTNIVYDSTGRIQTVSPPYVNDSSTQEGYTVAYDSYGQVTSRTIRTNVSTGAYVQTTYSYDSNGNLASVKPRNNPDLATTLTYDVFGNVTKVTDAEARETEFFYDYSGCGSCTGALGQLTKVIDPLDEETHYEYDDNGNLTKVTVDAGTGGLQRSTSYQYDGNNRLVKIISPTGSANEMTFTYNKLGLLTQRTSFEGVTTSYTYDHMGRVLKVIDSVGTFIEYVYDSMGKVVSVKDGKGNTTSYTYDTQFRLTKVTDHLGKEVHYTYDTDGRVTQVGAGTSGTFDKTVYTYNSTTGLLSQVTYHAGTSSHSANYYYDDAARVVKLTDWIDGTNGIQYEYDDLGRLETVRDYDGSELTYTYDEVGNIASMTDYHNNTINYTYTARDQLYTLTAPGSKVWTYTYNALGQPTQVDIPNGMHTAYSYDTRNRLTEIAHKDGSTVKQSFGHTLDDDGSITKITHEDGSYWDYDYDGRNRLTLADRKSSSGNVVGSTGTHTTPRTTC